MYFSLNPHSISIQSHFYRSSLTLSTLCHSSLPSFLHFLLFPINFIISLSPLLYYLSIHSNHIPCLLSSSHLHHAHHLAYSSIIHPTSSSFHPPSIPSFSHFSLFHSSISPWCSSRFPQNSFSLISFIISFYSLFHHSFHPISLPSPSSPHIFAFLSHSHPCSIFIHFLSIPIPFFLSTTSITLTPSYFHSTPLIPFHFIITIHSLSLY